MDGMLVCLVKPHLSLACDAATAHIDNLGLAIDCAKPCNCIYYTAIMYYTGTAAIHHLPNAAIMLHGACSQKSSSLLLHCQQQQTAERCCLRLKASHGVA